MQIVSKLQKLFLRFGFYSHVYSRCKAYLAPGVYRINRTNNIIYNYSSKGKAHTECGYMVKSIGHKVRFHEFFISLLFTRIKVCKSKFNATLLMMTSSGEESKLFDYSTNTLITVYDDFEKAERIFKNRQQWSKFFLTNSLNIERIEGSACIIEPLLNKVPFHTYEYFDLLVDQYIPNAPKLFSSDVGYEIGFVASFCRYIGCEISEDSILQYLKVAPKALTHGDMWPSNVLYDGTCYYHLDFEYVGNRIFFYDLYYYMFNDMFVLKNTFLFRNYLDGDYDEKLVAFFNSYGMSYFDYPREFYLLVTMYFIFLERWNKAGCENFMQIIRQFLIDNKML